MEGEEPLRFPRTVAAIESWSDASFGQDDGHRSQSGILLVVAGGLIAWHSHRQSITALSTAESEMISAVDSMTLARALSPICQYGLRYVKFESNGRPMWTTPHVSSCYCFPVAPGEQGI